MTAPNLPELRRLAETVAAANTARGDGFEWRQVYAAFRYAANTTTVLALVEIAERIEAVRALCATVDNAARLHDSYSEGWRDALNKVADILDGGES